MFGWRKGNVVADMLGEYLDKAEECVGWFRQGFGVYSEKGLSREFDELVEQVHIAESSCDDIRRRIETSLYKKALIPESRGDMLGLIESLDRVPNRAEAVLFKVQCQFLDTPAAYRDKILQLVHTNCDAFSDLATGVRCLMNETEKVRALISNVDKKESASDFLQRDITRAIFSDPNVLPDQRILLRDLVIDIGSISDRCENVGDRVSIILVKRLV